MALRLPLQELHPLSTVTEDLLADLEGKLSAAGVDDFHYIFSLSN